MTTPAQPGWYDDPENSNAQRYWDGHNWTPHRQRKNTTPTQRDPAPVAPPPPPQMSPSPPPPAPAQTPPPPPGPAGGPTPWEQVRPYVNKAQDGGRRFWSRQPRQRKIIWAVTGAVVAIVAVITFVMTALSTFGGGGSSSGHSHAWQDGYNSALHADPHNIPSLYCQIFSNTQSDEAARQDWINGCLAGFQKGSPPPRTVVPSP